MTIRPMAAFIYGFPKHIHDLAETYLTRDILKCDSLLVGRLLQQSCEGDCSSVSQAFSIDNIENYFDNSMEAIEEFLTYNAKEDDWHELSFDERETLAEELGFDPQPQEIYEWWAITEWLADNLSSLGQPILKNEYGQWWGRLCTGQAIILDGIMQKIAEQNT